MNEPEKRRMPTVDARSSGRRRPGRKFDPWTMTRKNKKISQSPEHWTDEEKDEDEKKKEKKKEKKTNSHKA